MCPYFGAGQKESPKMLNTLLLNQNLLDFLNDKSNCPYSKIELNKSNNTLPDFYIADSILPMEFTYIYLRNLQTSNDSCFKLFNESSFSSPISIPDDLLKKIKVDHSFGNRDLAVFWAYRIAEVNNVYGLLIVPKNKNVLNSLGQGVSTHIFYKMKDNKVEFYGVKSINN